MMVIFPMFSILLLMLSGCSTKEFHLGWYEKCLPSTIVVVEKEYPNISESLLECPEIPVPAHMTLQSEVSAYIVEITFSGRECKSNLKDVKMLLNEFKKDTDLTKG